VKPEYVVALIGAVATLGASSIGVVSQLAHHDEEGTGQQCTDELISLADLATKYPKAAELVVSGAVKLPSETGCTPPRVVIIALTPVTAVTAVPTSTTHP
jgi:hypothetical protein